MPDLSGIPTRHLEAAQMEHAILASQLSSGGECMPWRDWIDAVASSYARSEFADHHVEFWDWADQVFDDPDLTKFALLLWPRGHAKSTGVELATAKWGCCGHINYALYVCATQDLADDHISTIAAILESEDMERHYPEMAKPLLGKHGNSKGWRRNRVRTASGFTVDAIGLDTAARGAKMESHRPDLIILDDIDNESDSPNAVAKKMRTLTQAILPAGGDEVEPVVVLAQNLTHPNAIAKKLDDGSFEALAGALKIGPLPAVRDMEVEQDDQGIWRIIGGEPTWQGMNLKQCEDRIKRYTLSAFLLESQQQITDRKGALWAQALIDDLRMSRPNFQFDRIIVSVDPNKTGRGDDAGIVGIGRATPPGQTLPHAYVLDDGTELAAPSRWRDIAAEMLLGLHAGSFIVESTGAGELAELTLRGSPKLQNRPVEVNNVEAKMSKGDRARPVAQLYKDGRVHHCGVFPTLEAQMTGWVPGVGSMSPGGVDALVHGITHLLIEPPEPPAPQEWVGVQDQETRARYQRKRRD